MELFTPGVDSKNIGLRDVRVVMRALDLDLFSNTFWIGGSFSLHIEAPEQILTLCLLSHFSKLRWQCLELRHRRIQHFSRRSDLFVDYRQHGPSPRLERRRRSQRLSLKIRKNSTAK